MVAVTSGAMCELWMEPWMVSSALRPGRVVWARSLQSARECDQTRSGMLEADRYAIRESLSHWPRVFASQSAESVFQTGMGMDGVAGGSMCRVEGREFTVDMHGC